MTASNMIQPAIHETDKIPITHNAAPVMLVVKVELLVFVGSLPYRSAATLGSVSKPRRDSLPIWMKEYQNEQRSSQRGCQRHRR